MHTPKRNQIAQQALDVHARNLKFEFATFEERQEIFIDVFSVEIGSSENSASLQNQFVNGTLRPEIKFVSPKVLTDDYGNVRDAAFDNKNQTILLSEDLDAAGIKSSIEQELGHWWDVQLNGTEDTTTVDGKPFDEGTAYAERFSEGAQGDNIFSDVVYQNDSQTVLVNGKETDVEFRPIATWNIQGGTSQGNNTWANVFENIENPGQGLNPIEIMAVQEAGPTNIRPSLEQVADNNQVNATTIGNVVDYTFTRNNVPYKVYWTNGGVDTTLPTAIVLRNPPQEASPIYFENPVNPNNRPIIGVETREGFYFSVHATAGSGLNTGNDAESVIDFIRQEEASRNRPVFVLGDFNRNIAVDGNPSGNINAAFPNDANLLKPPNATTQNARVENPGNTLDYLFTHQDLLNPQGTVLNQLPGANTGNFPSDHFPVVYDDEDSNIDGTEQGENLSGTEAGEAIFGREGNDVINGLGGNDRLIGANVLADRPGAGEIDSLTGGAGADIFDLGNAETNFYADFPDTQIDDYAIIEDFEPGLDTIGVASSVNLVSSDNFALQNGPITGGVGIAIDRPDGGGNELIGIVRNATIDEVMAGIFEI